MKGNALQLGMDGPEDVPATLRPGTVEAEAEETLPGEGREGNSR